MPDESPKKESIILNKTTEILKKIARSRNQYNTKNSVQYAGRPVNNASNPFYQLMFPWHSRSQDAGDYINNNNKPRGFAVKKKISIPYTTKDSQGNKITNSIGMMSSMITTSTNRENDINKQILQQHLQQQEYDNNQRAKEMYAANQFAQTQNQAGQDTVQKLMDVLFKH